LNIKFQADSSIRSKVITGSKISLHNLMYTLRGRFWSVRRTGGVHRLYLYQIWCG